MSLTVVADRVVEGGSRVNAVIYLRLEFPITGPTDLGAGEGEGGGD